MSLMSANLIRYPRRGWTEGRGGGDYTRKVYIDVCFFRKGTLFQNVVTCQKSKSDLLIKWQRRLNSVESAQLLLNPSNKNI